MNIMSPPKILCRLLLSAGLALRISFSWAAEVDVQGAQFDVQDSTVIAKVASDFPVRFCLLTSGDHQYVGYYDDQRRMTIASRTLDSNQWQYQVLPTSVGWDSHNYITMAVDGDGHLHVSGNMHCVELIYFRTQEPGEIATLERLSMTGQEEDRTTYPQFFTDHKGRLVFTYRHGSSGRGKRIYNRYDAPSRTWSRLFDRPLLDGEGQRNAYPLGPVLGSQGWFHLVWVWRDTPDCATNHHLSYARSRDLLHWQSVFGKPVELPIVLSDERLWVDPIPSGGGIINGCERLTFDRQGRPLITYHKSDAQGHMQIYAARPEGTQWVPHPLTQWQQPIAFSGRGSMGFIGIRISGLSPVGPGLLTMTYRHRDYGHGRLIIDEQTLRPVNRSMKILREYPQELDHVHSQFPGMQIQRTADIGGTGNEKVRYLLQWETLGRNQDRPRKPPLPEPSSLRLVKLVANDF